MLADYAWNLKTYDSDDSWEHALKEIMPHTTDAFRTFASHNSDLGQNGHQYRRDESVEIKPVAVRFLNDYKQGRYDMSDFRTLQQEFIKIKESADILLASEDNSKLIEEINPWLHQFKLIGEIGGDVLSMVRALQQGDVDAFISLYDQVKNNKEKSFHIDQTYNQNPYQPGIKTASLIILPFIDSVFIETTTRFNEKYNQNLAIETNYCPHKLISNMEQMKNLPIQVKTNRIQITPLLEVVKWAPNAFVMIELDTLYPAVDIEINLGIKDIVAWGVLEISPDGSNWTAVELIQKDNTLKASLGNAKIKAIRFKNNNNKEQQAYMRKFALNIKK